MSKVLLALPLAALALLFGCASEEKASPAPIVVTTTAPPAAPVITQPPAVVAVPQATVPAVSVALRPGFGRIESIAAVPPSAAAGGVSNVRRIGVKMDDGSMQFLDTQAPNLNIGERIEVTPEGNIRR